MRRQGAKSTLAVVNAVRSSGPKPSAKAAGGVKNKKSV
jgi:hypothetical protein